MPESFLNRRHLLKVLGASFGMSILPEIGQAQPAAKSGFTYCFNLNTIRGHKLGLVKELETASKAGFRSV